MAQRAEPITARATARYVRMSPTKVRSITALIQGKHIDEARRVLAFTPRTAAEAVSKVLESAVANAEHNLQVPQEELVVESARADEGPILYRGRPRAQGRYYRIRKRTCHITVVLRKVEQEASSQPEAPEREQRARRPRRRSKSEEG